MSKQRPQNVSVAAAATPRHMRVCVAVIACVCVCPCVCAAFILYAWRVHRAYHWNSNLQAKLNGNGNFQSEMATRLRRNVATATAANVLAQN